MARVRVTMEHVCGGGGVTMERLCGGGGVTIERVCGGGGVTRGRVCSGGGGRTNVVADEHGEVAVLWREETADRRTRHVRDLIDRPA